MEDLLQFCAHLGSFRGKELAPPRSKISRCHDNRDISYYSIGRGPGLIIIHGFLTSALSNLYLASSLSNCYTVYLVSRCSRGLSDNYRKGPTFTTSHEAKKKSLSDKEQGYVEKAEIHGIPIDVFESDTIYDPAFSSSVLETDVAAIATLAKSTGAEYLLGISSGALIALQLALGHPILPESQIKKIILYNPPLLTPQTPVNCPRGYALEDFRESAKQLMERKIACLNTWIIGRDFPDPGFRFKISKWWHGFLVEAYLAEGKRKEVYRRFGYTWTNDGEKHVEPPALDSADHGRITALALTPYLHYDLALVEAMIGPVKRFADVKAEVLILIGNQCRKTYIGKAATMLAEVIGPAKRVDIKGSDFYVPGKGLSGRRATKEIKKFLN